MAVSEYQWFHISLKNIHIPQSRLEFLNAQGRHQTKSLFQYIQWFSVTTLQHAHPDLLYQRCRAVPLSGKGQYNPVLQLQAFPPALISLPVTPAKQQHQEPVPQYLELWHSCLAGTGSISCPRTTVTTAHPAASQVLPGPELLYPRKDTFPKAVWGEGGREQRHHYNPTSAPPSNTIKEKKKSHKPVVAPTLTHGWRLRWERRAGHSHGRRDRNTDPEFHSSHRGPAEPGARQGTPGALAGDTRSPPLGRSPGEGSVSCAVGAPITIPDHPLLPSSHLVSKHYLLSPRFPWKAGQTGTRVTHRCTHPM